MGLPALPAADYSRAMIVKRPIYTAAFRGRPFRFIRPAGRPAALHVFAEDLMRAWDISGTPATPEIARLVVSSRWPKKHQGNHQTADGEDHPTISVFAVRRSLDQSRRKFKRPTKSTIGRLWLSLADWFDEVEPKASRALLGPPDDVQKAPSETPAVSA